MTLKESPVTADFPDEVRCDCGQPDAPYTCFETVRTSVDPTDGRYADVAVLRCRRCARSWIRYQVEYEGFSRSGRFARGLISDRDAESITPEAAAPYLEALPWFIRGGSYYGGAGRSRGQMHWGP